MSVLIDSSVWIDYFKNVGKTEVVDSLINNNIAATNDLILAELIPYLRLKKQQTLINLLKAMERYPIDIDWSDIMNMQVICIQKGINKIGIPDLIIVQNAICNDLTLLSYDKHFELMSKHFPLSLY